jgi:hypothetical protein
VPTSSHPHRIGTFTEPPSKEHSRIPAIENDGSHWHHFQLEHSDEPRFGQIDPANGTWTSSASARTGGANATSAAEIDYPGFDCATNDDDGWKRPEAICCGCDCH